MMKNNKEEFEDPGITVADMSSLDQPSLLHPFGRKEKNTNVTMDDYDKETRKYTILATLKASLLIGSVYAIAFGILILLMYLYFRSKL